MSPGYTLTHCVTQVGLKLKSVILFSFPSAGIIGVSHNSKLGRYLSL